MDSLESQQLRLTQFVFLMKAIIANDKAYEELEQKMDHVEAFKVNGYFSQPLQETNSYT